MDAAISFISANGMLPISTYVRLISIDLLIHFDVR